MGEESDGDKGYYLHEIGGGGTATPYFFPTPYRRLVTLTWPDDRQAFEDSSISAFPVENAIVCLRVPQADADQVREMVARLEAAGAYEVRIEIERAETVRRREVEVHGLSLPDQITAWLAQKPDLHPLTEALIAEAMRVEAAMGGGAS